MHSDYLCDDCKTQFLSLGNQEQFSKSCKLREKMYTLIRRALIVNCTGYTMYNRNLNNILFLSMTTFRFESFFRYRTFLLLTIPKTLLNEYIGGKIL